MRRFDFLVPHRADAVGLAMLRNTSEAPAGREEAAMHRRTRITQPSLGNELGNGRVLGKDASRRREVEVDARSLTRSLTLCVVLIVFFLFYV